MIHFDIPRDILFELLAKFDIELSYAGSHWVSGYCSTETFNSIELQFHVYNKRDLK